MEELNAELAGMRQNAAKVQEYALLGFADATVATMTLNLLMQSLVSEGVLVSDVIDEIFEKITKVTDEQARKMAHGGLFDREMSVLIPSAVIRLRPRLPRD